MLYIIFNSLGIMVNSIINYYQLKNIIKKERLQIIVISLFCLLIGSKMMDYVVNYRYYSEYGLFESIQIGYMFYGGGFLTIICVLLFCEIKNIDKKKVLNIIVPNLCLMYAICKIGCYFNGCCSGRFNIPIQLLESATCLIVYFVETLKKDKNILAIICIIFGIIRIMDFAFRDEIELSNLIINELLSLLILMFGLLYKRNN